MCVAQCFNKNRQIDTPKSIALWSEWCFIWEYGRILLGIWSLRSLLKTVDFAEKNVSFQKNAHSENGRVGRLRREKCQKNTHSENGRVRRLRREKCQKNTHSERKRVRMLLFVWANWSHCNAMYFCYANPKRKEYAKCHCFFECFWKLFHSRNNALCEASDLYRFQKSPKEYVKNLSEVYRKQNDQKNGLSWKAIWSLRSLPFSVEGYQKNGISSSTNSTVFRRCPKEYAPSGPSEKFRDKSMSEWWMRQARKFMELSPMRRPSTMDEVGERINLTDTEAATQMWISRLPPSFKR